jgi:hypothetical protein
MATTISEDRRSDAVSQRSLPATLVSQKIGMGTPVMAKVATGYTDVAQK